MSSLGPVHYLGLSACLVGGLLQSGCGSAQPQESTVSDPAESEATAPIGATQWPLFRGDQGLTGVAAGQLPDKPELLWSFAAEGAITSSPVVMDGRIYFGSDDNKVYCLDAISGEPIWEYATEDMIEAPPIVVDGTVYIGSSDFFFYAIDAISGKLRWKYETEDRILGGANFLKTESGLCIVVASYDDSLYGLDAVNGKELWKYTTGNDLNGTPAVDGELTCFGGCDAILHVVSVATGEPIHSIEFAPDSHIAGSPAIQDGRAYFGHYGNQFICVDLATKETIWHYDNPRHAFFSSPALGEDRVVFGGRDRFLHCVNKEDGSPIWTFRTGRKVDSSPVICGDRVVFGSGDGRLYILDLEKGEEQWSYDIGKALVASPAVVDGMIYIGCNDYKLYAFGTPKSE